MEHSSLGLGVELDAMLDRLAKGEDVGLVVRQGYV
jgi:hypothetical protein